MGYTSQRWGELASSGPAPSSGTRGYTSWGRTSFYVVAFVWAVFGAVALFSPETLTGIWDWAVALPMIGKILVWVLALPWMLGLAVMQADWPTTAEVASIVGIAIISLATFYQSR